MTTKLTFAEMQNKVQAEKNNSDLMNLANALEGLTATRKQLLINYNKALEEITFLENKIKDTASLIETGEVFDVSVIRKVFTEAQKISLVNL